MGDEIKSVRQAAETYLEHRAKSGEPDEAAFWKILELSQVRHGNPEPGAAGADPDVRAAHANYTMKDARHEAARFRDRVTDIADLPSVAWDHAKEGVEKVGDTYEYQMVDSYVRSLLFIPQDKSDYWERRIPRYEMPERSRPDARAEIAEKAERHRTAAMDRLALAALETQLSPDDVLIRDAMAWGMSPSFRGTAGGEAVHIGETILQYQDGIVVVGAEDGIPAIGLRFVSHFHDENGESLEDLELHIKVRDTTGDRTHFYTKRVNLQQPSFRVALPDGTEILAPREPRFEELSDVRYVIHGDNAVLLAQAEGRSVALRVDPEFARRDMEAGGPPAADLVLGDLNDIDSIRRRSEGD